VARRPARAADAHQELPEGIIELLDVSEHAHARMVRIGRGDVNAAPAGARDWIGVTKVFPSWLAVISRQRRLASRLGK